MKHSTEIPKKILMTADTVGGVWTYAIQLIKALNKDDIKVHLATMGGLLSPGQWQEVDTLHNVAVYESEFKLEWMPDPWEDITEAGKWLLQLEREIKPDLIHLNNYAHGSLPWSSPVLMVAHSCVLSWWKAVKKTAVPAEWNAYAQKVKEGLQSVDMIVSVSDYMKQTLVQNYGNLPLAKAIYNGADDRQFMKGKKEEYIFAMGRIWDEAKNLFVLEEIAKSLPWPIMLAGENKHPSNGNHHQFYHIQPKGQLTSGEIAELLRHAPIYVLPAKYEPFGLSVLEAALSGCALILGDIPSLREIWQDAAVFINPEDSEQLKNELLKLINDKALRQTQSEKAIVQAKKYSMQSMASQYSATYSSLIKKKKHEHITC